MSEPAIPTAFSTLIDSMAHDGDGWTATVGEDWMQGRTTYGGMSAALCVEAAKHLQPGLPPLRSAQFAFIGPASGLLRATPAVLRQGKSATFMGVDLTGDGATATRAILCFGAARPSALVHDQATAPSVAPPEDCPDFFGERRGPSFAQHFEVRVAGGARPMTGAKEPEYLLWLRHRDPKAREGMTALVALADMPPPAAMALFTAPAPISTMTWTLDVVGEDQPGDGWRLMRTTAETVADGYSSQAMSLWDRDGKPLVLARQTVAVFG